MAQSEKEALTLLHGTREEVAVNSENDQTFGIVLVA